VLKALLVAGGIVNLIFAAFHIWLGWQIHQIAGVTAGVRALMEALNVAGTLFIIFFAHISLFHQSDLVSTGLGRASMVFVVLLYWSRAAEEFFLFRFNPAIFFACLFAGGIYAALIWVSTRTGRAG
jgi:hypothetical protein